VRWQRYEFAEERLGCIPDLIKGRPGGAQPAGGQRIRVSERVQLGTVLSKRDALPRSVPQFQANIRVAARYDFLISLGELALQLSYCTARRVP
jgi:hypothetical protein